MILERTSEAQKAFDKVVSAAVPAVNPFEDDTPLACGVENPESCETCD